MARIDHDGLFKLLLGEVLQEFVEAFVPSLAAVVDWSQCEKLDKETFIDAAGRRRKVKDLVVKVRIAGQMGYLLIHVEHQAQRQADFARRMFTYFARLHEKYELPIYPIVLCSYARPQRPEPDRYAMTVAGLPVLGFQFGVVQLNRMDWRDYRDRPNAAVSALMAKMNVAAEDRPHAKVACLRMLANLRLTPRRAMLIGTFLETYLTLEPAEEAVFEAAVEQLQPRERKRSMEYMTLGERKGVERAAREMRETSLEQVRAKFGKVHTGVKGQIETLTWDQLRAFQVAIVRMESADELRDWLSNQSVEPD